MSPFSDLTQAHGAASNKLQELSTRRQPAIAVDGRCLLAPRTEAWLPLEAPWRLAATDQLSVFPTLQCKHGFWQWFSRKVVDGNWIPRHSLMSKKERKAPPLSLFPARAFLRSLAAAGLQRPACMDIAARWHARREPFFKS